MCINLSKIPDHVGIIMDGNGRWAQNRGMDRSFGHSSSTKYLNQIIDKSLEYGIKYVSLFGFSTENWKRSSSEISLIFNVIEKSINNELGNVIQRGIKVCVIGDISCLPASCRIAIEKIVEKSEKNFSLILTLAINYSGKWEILDAIKKIIADCVNVGDKFDVKNFQYSDFEDYTVTRGLPEIDLLIRTGGELRLSNFMISKLAYSELYFTEKMWPDFSVIDYENAIFEYGRRSRRYGKA